MSVLALAFAPQANAAPPPPATAYSFPAHWRANFMNGCTDGGAEAALCGCVLEGLEFSWPFWVAEEYDVASSTQKEQRTARQNELMAAAERIVIACFEDANAY